MINVAVELDVTLREPLRDVIVMENDSGSIVIQRDEQRELLEALARIHGFTLVDHEERKSLLTLTQEVDEAAAVDRRGMRWQKRCEALSAAVCQALQVKEV